MAFINLPIQKKDHTESISFLSSNHNYIQQCTVLFFFNIKTRNRLTYKLLELKLLNNRGHSIFLIRFESCLLSLSQLTGQSAKPLDFSIGEATIASNVYSMLVRIKSKQAVSPLASSMFSEKKLSSNQAQNYQMISFQINDTPNLSLAD